MSSPSEAGAAQPASGAREAYIYYRIDTAAEAGWREQLLALQHALGRRHAGLRSGLLRRSDAAGSQVTLMETYALGPLAAPGLTLDAVLHEVEARCAALPGRPAAPRHLEVFERCA